MLAKRYYGSIGMREMKHRFSINYIVLQLVFLVGCLKSIWEIVHAYPGREHVQQHHKSIRYGNSEELTIFTAIALTRLVHMISSTPVEYSKYNPYEKVK